jgi:hypothetical protein
MSNSEKIITKITKLNVVDINKLDGNFENYGER